MPRVSIVTISFNQAEFLERAIRSVVEQDYPDANIPWSIRSDGWKPRHHRAIQGRGYQGHSGTGSGPSNGLNKGFAAATGEIFGYINADDAYLPGALAKMVAAFEARPKADVIYGHSYIVDRAGRLVRRSRSVHFNLRLYAYGGCIIMQQSSFFRRQAFEKAGGFNENNRTSWDGELFVDLALNGSRFAMVDNNWSLYAIYPGSITASVKHNRQYQADRARMFQAITGREQDRTNKIFFDLARIEKWVRNPLVPLHRIIDKSRARPRLPAMAVSSFL